MHYDHGKDPDELDNLADDPEYKEVRDRLMAKLDAWLKQQGYTDPAKTELDALNRVGKGTREEAIELLKEIKYPGFTNKASPSACRPRFVIGLASV